MPDDENLDEVMTGEEDTAEEAAFQDEPEAVDDDLEPEPEPAPDPVQARIAALTEENRQLRGVLSTVQQARPEQPAARPHSTPQRYVNPNARDDVKPWQQLIGETVQPVIEEELASIKQEQARANAVHAFLASEQRARGMFRDYGTYEAEVGALIQSWIPALAAVPAGLHEYAYRIIKAQAGERKSVGTARKRVSAGSSVSQVTTAKRRVPVSNGALTPERVSRMSGKDAFEWLKKNNTRVL